MMRVGLAKMLLALLLLSTVGGALSACNTTRGIGEDMQSGGRALSDSAERHQ